MLVIISHRGNQFGPALFLQDENTWNSIQNAVKFGFHVEIDLWHVHENEIKENKENKENKEKEFKCGHESHWWSILTFEQIHQYRHQLWIHTKSIPMLSQLIQYNQKCIGQDKDQQWHYFFHQQDDVTLTSDGWMWTFPRPHLYLDPDHSIAVLPEYHPQTLIKCKQNEVKGICTDYPWAFAFQDLPHAISPSTAIEYYRKTQDRYRQHFELFYSHIICPTFYDPHEQCDAIFTLLETKTNFQPSLLFVQIQTQLLEFQNQNQNLFHSHSYDMCIYEPIENESIEDNKIQKKQNGIMHLTWMPFSKWRENINQNINQNTNSTHDQIIQWLQERQMPSVCRLELFGPVFTNTGWIILAFPQWPTLFLLRDYIKSLSGCEQQDYPYEIFHITWIRFMLLQNNNSVDQDILQKWPNEKDILQKWPNEKDILQKWYEFEQTLVKTMEHELNDQNPVFHLGHIILDGCCSPKILKQQIQMKPATWTMKNPEKC